MNLIAYRFRLVLLLPGIIAGVVCSGLIAAETDGVALFGKWCLRLSDSGGGEIGAVQTRYDDVFCTATTFNVRLQWASQEEALGTYELIKRNKDDERLVADVYEIRWFHNGSVEMRENKAGVFKKIHTKMARLFGVDEPLGMVGNVILEPSFDKIKSRYSITAFANDGRVGAELAPLKMEDRMRIKLVRVLFDNASGKPNTIEVYDGASQHRTILKIKSCDLHPKGM